MIVALNASGNLIEGPKFETSKHLETLMPAVDELLIAKDFDIRNIDYLGVVVGPGSFTGIRIAVSTAKAMMMVNKNIKAVAVNSLRLMAESYYKEKGATKEKIVCVIPTTIKKVYYAKFDVNGRLGEDSICELQNLKEIADGFVIVASKQVLDNAKVFEVTAKHLNDFVERQIMDNNFATDLVPEYIGLSQAEEQLKDKENK
jgi:tRNA threonylcarbamoyl adenosine modification protein YeaZ